MILWVGEPPRWTVPVEHFVRAGLPDPGGLARPPGLRRCFQGLWTQKEGLVAVLTPEAAGLEGPENLWVIVEIQGGLLGLPAEGMEWRTEDDADSCGILSPRQPPGETSRRGSPRPIAELFGGVTG